MAKRGPRSKLVHPKERKHRRVDFAISKLRPALGPAGVAFSQWKANPLSHFICQRWKRRDKGINP